MNMARRGIAPWFRSFLGAGRFGKVRSHAGMRRIGLEPLEERTLLAGIVTVSVSQGNLILRGDNAANGIHLTQIGEGSYQITGLVTGGSATTIKHGAVSGTSAVVEGVTGNIDIDLKRGDDLLAIGNDADCLIAGAETCGFSLELPGEGNGPPPIDHGGDVPVGEATWVEVLVVPRNLLIYMGDGHDRVALSAQVRQSAVIDLGNQHDRLAVVEAQIDGTLDIRGGKGDDRVCIYETQVQQTLSVLLGDGHDTLEVQGIVNLVGAIVSPEVRARQVVVQGQNGNDTILLYGLHASGNIEVSGGSGQDRVELGGTQAQGAIGVSLGGGSGGPFGNILLVYDSTSGGNLTVVGGNQSDYVLVSNSQVGGNLVIDTGGGQDRIELRPQVRVFGNLVVDAGAGNDQVNLGGELLVPASAEGEAPPGPLAAVAVDKAIVVAGGSGHDWLLLHNTSSGQSTTVNGGAGDDTLDLFGVAAAVDLILAAGAGRDLVSVEEGSGPSTQVGRDLVVDLGADNDTLGLRFTAVGRHLAVLLGSGNDHASLYDGLSVGGDLTVDGGAGHDEVTLQYVFVSGSAAFALGAGNDRLSIGDSQVQRTLTVLMGDGDDRFSFSQLNFGLLVARGGNGKDRLINDIGIVANGTTSTTDVQQFEFFESVGEF